MIREVASTPDRGSGRPRGVVYLVGAGPGDPGLLTVAAARLLRRADVVVYDALVGSAILDLIPSTAVRIDVGKRCGGRRTSQETIHEILLESAARHRTVVRLKGGDPFVFGRGGEEALALTEAGVRFRIVPGITAGVGVSAYAGIPVTHRRVSASVTFVTGHEDIGGAQSRIDWTSLARIQGTLVLYMGVGTLGSIAERLIASGKDAATPAAVIQWGTIARQRTVSGPLREIARLASEEGIGSPALVVIGEVVSLRDTIAWFDRAPLHGRRVIVARSRPQRSRIAGALRRAGAEVLEAPRLTDEAVPASGADVAAIVSAGEADWVVFSSVPAVRHFWQILTAAGGDARSLGGARVAGLGAETSKELRRRGIVPEVETRTFDVDRVAGLLEEGRRLGGGKVLFVRDASLPSPIATLLRDRGAIVHELGVFETRRLPADPADFADADFVVFPSSSSVRELLASGWRPSRQNRVVAIGPSTAEVAQQLGVQVGAIADEHSVEGVLRSIRRLLRDDEEQLLPELLFHDSAPSDQLTPVSG